jgi:hypothetical protein
MEDITNQDKTTKSIFLTDWDPEGRYTLPIDHAVIKVHGTNKETAEVLTGFELIFENDKLQKSFYLNNGERREHEIASRSIGLDFCEIKENRKLHLVQNNNGPHQLGGEIPNEFVIPQNNFRLPFQYLGYISEEQEEFNWLPFTLHLIFPIYLDIDTELFIDYKNPNIPKIINSEFLEHADTEHEDLEEDTEIIYNRMKFSFIEKKENFTTTVLAGIPDWIQRREIPTCPKSGNIMQFVCQINGGVTTKKTNFDIDEKEFGSFYEDLNFGDCDLYVFFEPTTKVACYLLQGS